MGNNKDTTNKAEIESETFKNNEINSQDANSRIYSLRSMANDMHKKRIANITEECFSTSSSSSSSLDIDSLKIRSISVKLTRLPDAVVSKYMPTLSKTVKKRKRKHSWKNGTTDRNRRYLRHRLQVVRGKAALGKSLETEFDGKIINDVEKSRHNGILDSEMSIIAMSAVREESPSEKFELPIESPAIKENEVRKSTECTKICKPTVEERPTLEPLASKPSIIIETPVASHHKPEQINLHEISDKLEICLGTEGSEKTSDVATKIACRSSPIVLEQSNNQNRKISLRRLRRTNKPISIESMETRKRTFEPDDGKANEPQVHLFKKCKTSNRANRSAGKESTDGENTKKVIEIVTPIAKQVTPKEWSRYDIRRFFHPLTKPTKKSVLKETTVDLWRLEVSDDPLVLKWKLKRSLEHLNNITATASTTTSPTKNRSEENLEFESVAAGVSVTTLDDSSRIFDASKEFNEPRTTVANSISKEDSFASLCDEPVAPMACEETDKSQDDDNDDEDDEIVQFVSRRKTRPSIDSSNATGSSTSEEIITTRVLRSKTPVVNASCSAKITDFQKTKKTDNSSSEDINNLKEIRKTLPHLREETRRTPLLRKRIMMESLTFDSSYSREEIRRHPSTRRKAFRVAINGSTQETTLSASRLLSSLSSEEETSDCPLTHNSSNRKEVPKHDENEAGITDECANVSVSRTSNLVTCESNLEGDVSLEYHAKVNSDFSGVKITRSNNRDENLTARRKLTALKNAMVVLTRLEELDGLNEDNRYSSNDMKFSTTEDFEFSIGPTPDPLQINGDDNQNSLRETDNVICYLGGATRACPKRTPKVADMINEGIESAMPESDVEITLGLDDPSSQETIESDVEMTLLLEENSSSQETQNSDAESVKSRNAHRTIRNNSETPDSVALDIGKAADPQYNQIANSTQSSSVISLRNLPEGVLTDANSISGDSRNATVHGNEDLDEHCPCDEHQSDKRLLKCQNIPATHKCLTCRGIFKDAVSLEEHKRSSVVCSCGFLCNACQATFSTLPELTKHRDSCTNQVSEKSVDDSKVEESTETENPLNAMVEPLTAKAKEQRKEQPHKNVSKKFRSKNRSRVENCTCGVCSMNFATTQDLFEHIFKHNTEELQEAYRNAKPKVLEDSQTSKTVSVRQKNEKVAAEQMVNNNTSVEAMKDNSLPQESSADIVEPVATITSIPNKDTAAKSVTVCSCHRDKQTARADKTDLQIEMVLLCQHCMVIFRRRECFEIHYRTSPQCANDRARGRWPKLYCANCQSTLNSWAGMRRHLEVHARLNVEGTVRFVCNICRVVFVGFGALFYNHWCSHLKDTTFVASRYTFPKNSVQPIDGIPKLPYGASPNESYILVAEHVCSCCKKPFSTRRDLEMHEKSKTCIQTDGAGEIERAKRWHCDVCSFSFPSRRYLNQHSKTQHDRRFLCVATSPLKQAFMCTRCFAMKKFVAEIEDHWKTEPQHEVPLRTVEAEAFPKRAFPQSISGAINSDDNDETTNGNQVPENSSIHTSEPLAKTINSSGKSKVNDKTPVIDIVEDLEKEPEIDCVFQSLAKTSEKLVASENNEESTKSASTTVSTLVAMPDNASLLRNLLAKPSMETSLLNNAEKKQIRALEDPCVNIVISDASNGNVSAKLVINENKKKAVSDGDDLSCMDSYKIISIPKPTSEHMVLGKAGSTSSSEKDAIKTTVSASEVKDNESIRNTSAATIVSTGEPYQISTATDTPAGNTLIDNQYTAMPITESEKKNSELSKALEANQMDQSNSAWLNRRSAVPEIIDLVDEKEAQETKTSETPLKTSESTRVIDKSKVIACNHPSSPKSKKLTTKVKSLKSNSSDVFPFVLNTSDVSFEEARFEYFMRSKQLATNISGAAKKPGFLRVKNLSELQAIKTHYCQICNATFESHNMLVEHRRVSCNPSRINSQNPEGMKAALILPDPNPIATPTQLVPNVYAAGNVVTQQLIGVEPGLGVISGVPVSSVIMNNDTAGSWITVSSQQDPIPAVAMVNTRHSLTGGTLFMNLGGQQSSNNTSTVMATSIATSSATIAQTQEILTVHQPSILNISQKLNENCGGQLGFHVMPAMVIPPKAHMDKQQYIAGPLRNTSTTNLPINSQIDAPFTCHSDKPNRYLCNICTTFRCNSIGIMNSHVMKHYSGFNASMTSQNSTQSAPGTNTSYFVTNEGNSQSATVRGNGTVSNPPNDEHNSSWFIKNTPQGVVWVTSLSSAANQQQESSAVEDTNNQMNNTATTIRGGRMIYRCLRCKSAMYKTYPALRAHMIHVHGIADIFSEGFDNIVQRIYLCVHCPHGSTMYDNEEALRHHIHSCHTNICPKCGRLFISNHNLKTHLGYCTGIPQNTSDNC